MRKANEMKLKRMIRLLLLAGLLSGSAPVAQAFFNPSSGRWMSRDPIAERGGMNVYGFVNNNSVSQFDVLGLKCCVLFYDSPTWNHSAIECDGVYISAFPANGLMVGDDDIKWHEKSEDERRYGSPTDKVCFDCIKDSSISEWFDKYKTSSPKFCGADNNCSDITLQAILATLSEEQKKKPECPKCPWYAGPYNRYVTNDLLSPNGPTTPSLATSQVKAWKDNNCNQYKCELFAPPIR